MQDEDESPATPTEPDKALPDEDYPDDETYGLQGDDGGYTSSDFHNVIQKQVLNATYETLVETKLHWGLIEPFLHAAREMCRGDFRRTGRVRIHGATAEGESEGPADAEEAFVSLSIADQDDGQEWLAQTWWLSDLILAGGDPEHVREAARALDRTKAKLDAWLDANGKGPDEDG